MPKRKNSSPSCCAPTSRNCSKPRGSATLLFAYGSNLDLGQMRLRCAKVEVAGIAVLTDYRLIFAGWSDRWSGAVASIERQRGSRVPGVLYQLDQDAVEALDRFEGHPLVYRRKRVRVFAADKRWRYAQAYELQGPVESAPGSEYLSVIRRAYGIWGFAGVPRFQAALERHGSEAKAAKPCRLTSVV